MSYLQDFVNYVDESNIEGLKRLWEEYCTCDEINPEELIKILKYVKASTLEEEFGKHVEWILPLWNGVREEKSAYEIIKLVFDLETSNSLELAALAYGILKKYYGTQNYFNEKIRLVGLRQKTNFRGALRSYELLTHLNKGSFVYHIGGWGVGEIMDLSLVREQLIIEFENVTGLKDVSFENAFKNLIPLQKDHFLARRFGDPDGLETLARKHPLEAVKMLLTDIGSRSAGGIKDELFELVIPKEDWSKWWQQTRVKMKKDTMVECPKSVSGNFIMRVEGIAHEECLQSNIEKATTNQQKLTLIYSFARDFAALLQQESVSDYIKIVLYDMLGEGPLAEERLQIKILLQEHYGEQDDKLEQAIMAMENVFSVVEKIDILSLKKRVLMLVREKREDWINIFLDLFLQLEQSSIKDYLLRELREHAPAQLKESVDHLLDNPISYPYSYVWYFQKLLSKDSKGLPYSDIDGMRMFLDGFLVLLHKLEGDRENINLTKKMHNQLVSRKYQVIRDLIEGADLPYLQEFLLLISKCNSFEDHEVKILNSLAEVVNPKLKKLRKDDKVEDDTLVWTTQEGLNKVKNRLEHISTIETIENAKEIEAARALGDLRENAEFKAALERRARLQGEMAMLGRQLENIKIIDARDVAEDKVTIGARVHLHSKNGEKIIYTILGPWDADTDKNIISFQSKLAENMLGCRLGKTFNFQKDVFKVTEISNALA